MKFLDDREKLDFLLKTLPLVREYLTVEQRKRALDEIEALSRKLNPETLQTKRGFFLRLFRRGNGE